MLAIKKNKKEKKQKKPPAGTAISSIFRGRRPAVALSMEGPE
jgi:hypothetical protein